MVVFYFPLCKERSPQNCCNKLGTIIHNMKSLYNAMLLLLKLQVFLTSLHILYDSAPTEGTDLFINVC